MVLVGLCGGGWGEGHNLQGGKIGKDLSDQGKKVV